MEYIVLYTATEIRKKIKNTKIKNLYTEYYNNKIKNPAFYAFTAKQQSTNYCYNKPAVSGVVIHNFNKSSFTMQRSAKNLAINKETQKDTNKDAQKDTKGVSNQDRHSEPNEDIYQFGPTPNDLEHFLPWACARLNVSKTVIVERVEADKYVSVVKSAKQGKKTAKSEIFKSRVSESSKTDALKESIEVDKEANSVPILATYSGDQVIKLTFSQCNQIPRIVIKILGLIIKFHPNLTSIVITKGLSKYVISEIVTILNGQCSLSSLYFDGCILPKLPDANFHTLLNPASQLTELSLGRCFIGDDMLALICERLVYPSPASKTLTVLNLPSNNITDVGAVHLGLCLRSNRSLKYINLADNQITNTGLEEILAPLLKFTLTEDEVCTSGSRFIEYWKKKSEYISGILCSKSTTMRSPLSEVKKKQSRMSKQNDEDMMYRRAEAYAIQTLGEFNDPFAPSQYETVNSHKICNGNSALCYLNMSYNHLDIFALQKILEILNYQKKDLSGIVNLRLDGNPLPLSCQELIDINDILDQKLSNLTKTKGSSKKKG